MVVLLETFGVHGPLTMARPSGLSSFFIILTNFYIVRRDTPYPDPRTWPFQAPSAYTISTCHGLTHATHAHAHTKTLNPSRCVVRIADDVQRLARRGPTAARGMLYERSRAQEVMSTMRTLSCRSSYRCAQGPTPAEHCPRHLCSSCSRPYASHVRA